MNYKTSGVCAQSINLEIENGIIKEVSFMGGCNGNLKGISTLVVGENAAEIAKKLKGTRCGMRSTSCPDQLANAIEQVLANNA